MRRRAVAAAWLLAASLMLPAGLAPAFAQSVTIAASGAPTKSVDAATVERLPAAEQRIDFLTGHGTETATYTGALLWTVLQQAGVLADDPRARLHQTVMVSGHDGYLAALAVAEFDPAFEGKPVLLAYRRDGQVLPGELRLVVPGDRRGGRSVREVVRLEVR